MSARHVYILLVVYTRTGDKMVKRHSAGQQVTSEICVHIGNVRTNVYPLERFGDRTL